MQEGSVVRLQSDLQDNLAIVTFGNDWYSCQMAFPPNQDKLKERSLLLVLLTLLLFASPLTMTWASSSVSWLLPYILWLLVIAIGAWLHYRYGRHDV